MEQELYNARALSGNKSAREGREINRVEMQMVTAAGDANSRSNLGGVMANG